MKKIILALIILIFIAGCADKIKETIATLPSDQQDVITMKFINELSNKEIAIALDKSEDAVRQLQSRALKTIRANTKQYGIL